MFKNKNFSRAKNKIIVITTMLLLPLPGLAKVVIHNPLKAQSISKLAGNIINGLLGITGALSLFFLVWGGILWMTSAGNADRVKKGKDSIVWAILGILVVFLSYVVIEAVLKTLDNSA
ncbi:pilin [bacterium]|nr:pilin [bacterium]